MSITTKTGDQGETSLYSLERVPKSHPRIEALGTLDELSARLAGLQLENIQEDLLAMGALLADTRIDPNTVVLNKELQLLEQRTASMEKELPPLQNFILPGGTPEAIRTHEARAICRRAERCVSRIQPLPKNLVPYLNRLSDFLFVLARHFNHQSGVKEVVWHSQKVL